MSAVIEAPADPVVPFEPGIRTDLSNEDYHSIEALSASGIKRLLQSPMHYRWDRDNPSDPTDSMAMGTALHQAILEPDNQSVIIVPDEAPRRPTAQQRAMEKRTTAAAKSIAFWDEFNERAKGRVVLTEDQAAKVNGMAMSVRRHPVYTEFLKDGHAEISFQWRDPRSEIPCKCRFDYLRDDAIALDVKTCVDASADGFARAVASFKYHYQAAWYNTGHEVLRDQSLQAFIFIAVENTAPYGCACYVLQSNAIHFGADQCERAMLLYAQARKTGFWRGYPESISALHLPRWATMIATPDHS